MNGIGMQVERLLLELLLDWFIYFVWLWLREMVWKEPFANVSCLRLARGSSFVFLSLGGRRELGEWRECFVKAMQCRDKRKIDGVESNATRWRYASPNSKFPANFIPRYFVAMRRFLQMNRPSIDWNLPMNSICIRWLHVAVLPFNLIGLVQLNSRNKSGNNKKCFKRRGGKMSSQFGVWFEFQRVERRCQTQWKIRSICGYISLSLFLFFLYNFSRFRRFFCRMQTTRKWEKCSTLFHFLFPFQIVEIAQLRSTKFQNIYEIYEKYKYWNFDQIGNLKI